MTTISGIFIGIVTAAAVTVFYGDAINAALIGLSPFKQETTAQETVPKQQLVDREPSAAQEEASIPEVGTVVPHSAPGGVVDRSPDSALSVKWAKYAEQAASLAPVGEFRWRECFQRAAAAHQVDEALLLAVASGESGFDAAARSDSDAVGLMQIRWPDTARHLGITREADLYDPCTNVDAGARYLAELAERYHADLHRAVAAYNYGPGRIGDRPLPEGAQWYSQYIYRHLQKVLGRSYGASSEKINLEPRPASGFEVLLSFSQPYRARDFLSFLQLQAPQLRLVQRSETLGRYEVVLLYEDQEQRRQALQAIQQTGLMDFTAATGNTL